MQSPCPSSCTFFSSSFFFFVCVCVHLFSLCVLCHTTTDLDTVAWQTRELCLVTHADPRCVASCVVVTIAVSSLRCELSFPCCTSSVS